MTTLVQIKDYQSHDTDYCRTESGVGLCEIQGKRKNQQDALAVCQHDLAAFTKFAPVVRDSILQATVAKMQADHGCALKGGSTLCGVIAWQDRATNQIHMEGVNVGDSSAYFVFVDDKNQRINVNRLNTLHHLSPHTNPQEYRRVCKSGYQPVFNHGVYRLDCGLMMSRSIGDQRSERYGLSHQPDIIRVSQPLQEGQSAYIVLACDGLDVLYDKPNEYAIAKRIANQASAKASNEAMALNLVSKAYRSGSLDNISVAVFKITEVPTSALVLDGHGDLGEVVANKIAKTFYPSLQEYTDKALVAQKDKEQQLKVIQQDSAQLPYEEKIQLIKNKLILLRQVTGDFLNLEENLANLKTKISTTYLNELLSINKIKFPVDASNQYSQAFIDDLKHVYAYQSLSDTEKESLIDDIFLTLEEVFYRKKDFFTRLSSQLDKKIELIEAHIESQPMYNERWGGFFTARNQGAKNNLLRAIKRLKFNPETIPVYANDWEYTKKFKKLTELLENYERELIQNNSKRHLNSYHAFKATFNASETIPDSVSSPTIPTLSA